MTPHLHARSSAKQFGGKAEDYMPIHEFMDSSKAHIADHRHRAMFHHSFGCFIVERIFGVTAKNSDGKEYSPRDVAEQHVFEDLGRIPSVYEYLKDAPIEQWMGGPITTTRTIPMSDVVSDGLRARRVGGMNGFID